MVGYYFGGHKEQHETKKWLHFDGKLQNTSTCWYAFEQNHINKITKWICAQREINVTNQCFAVVGIVWNSFEDQWETVGWGSLIADLNTVTTSNWRSSSHSIEDKDTLFCGT